MGAAIRSFHDLGNHIFCRRIGDEINPEARRQRKLVIGDVHRRARRPIASAYCTAT